jgi:glucose/arabinose dehydrogenase
MKLRRLSIGLIGALAACSRSTIQSSSSGDVNLPEQACTPLETRKPNAEEQEPAFKGQTRGCGLRTNPALDVTVIARGLEKPWSVEPLPGGDFLVTEKPGRLRIVTANGLTLAPITGVLPVDSRGQGGLLDVALSPNFATDHTIFWSFSEPRDGGNGTSVARGVLSADRKSLSEVRVIYRTLPAYNGTMHYGSRLAFAPDGDLFITTGERSDTPMRHYAQSLESHLGKVLRIRPDGSAPPDNPFVNTPNAQPQIFSLGHRNIQASSIDPQGRLWIIEHGTNGGDELNLIQKGKNYGWPLQAYGEEYSGRDIASAETQRAGMEQPVYYWDPVIAPSGAQWYTGDAFPAWKGNLFVGALKEMRLVRLVIQNDRVVGEEHLLNDRGHRIRDVRQGPDGFLYIVTDDTNGELWRVAPKR